ncbi:MAG: PEGA domain-containing protein [bacterium]|nr:PEGA domain-containing protein [bacterium]
MKVTWTFARSLARQYARGAVCAGLLLVLMGLLTGCVRRSLTVRTAPSGALVYLNDEEVGRSPVTTDFLWYGDYDVILRKEGHQTLKTHAVIRAPWYQVPPLDFFAEALYPGRIHDERFLSFELEPEDLPGRDELIERAETFRQDEFSNSR